jgi:hypothetical protein
MRLRTIAILSAIALAVAIALTVSPLGKSHDGSPAVSQSAALQGVQAELAKADYSMTAQTTHYSGNAGRDVHDQTWIRSEEPETVVVTDDTAAGAGVWVVNVIKFSGIEGDGELSCQPLPGVSSSLADLIAEGQSMRKPVHAGTLKPNGKPGGFPYVGKLVGCMP